MSKGQSMEHGEVPARIAKRDAEKRLIYCEVYVPNVLDAHGHYMTPEDVEEMAHGYLASGATANVDYNHDNVVDRGCYVVESFVARPNDPDFPPGAWVATIYVGDDERWDKIQRGEITGVSMEAWVYKEPA